jgi:hypothetical protein
MAFVPFKCRIWIVAWSEIGPKLYKNMMLTNERQNYFFQALFLIEIWVHVRWCHKMSAAADSLSNEILFGKFINQNWFVLLQYIATHRWVVKLLTSDLTKIAFDVSLSSIRMQPSNFVKKNSKSNRACFLATKVLLSSRFGCFLEI